MPSFVECLWKYAIFLGFGYKAQLSDEESNAQNGSMRKTEKNRIKVVKSIENQYFQYKAYLGETINLFTDSEQKKQSIEADFFISEILVRFLTSKNYYTIASEKRAIWALLVFFYIPHIACIFGVYKKQFGLPDALVKHGFMFPYINNDSKIKLPNNRLGNYLSFFEKEIKKTNKVDDGKINTLIGLLKRSDRNFVLSYDTKCKVCNEIKSVSYFDKYIYDVNILFHAAIVSGNINSELTKLFGQSNALELFRYFKVCMEMQDSYLNDEFTDYSSSRFNEYFTLYMNYHETSRECALNMLKNELIYDVNFEESEKNRDTLLNELFDNFDSFLHSTNVKTKDVLDFINIEGKEGIFRNYNSDILDLDHENLINILKDLECIFACGNIVLNETTVTNLLGRFKENSYYSNYEHDYLYYEALNYFARNNFKEAKDKLVSAQKMLGERSANDTSHDVATYLILSKLQLISGVCLSHLNPLIKFLAEAQEDELFFPSYLERNEKWQKLHNIEKIISIIIDFNYFGYAHYVSFECVKYTPFKRLDDFIGDFYKRYDKITHRSQSEKSKIDKILKTLMLGINSKYKINSYLVQLFEFKAMEVFEPKNFNVILPFYDLSGMQSQNISRLTKDLQTLELIREIVKKLSTPPEK